MAINGQKGVCKRWYSKLLSIKLLRLHEKDDHCSQCLFKIQNIYAKMYLFRKLQCTFSENNMFKFSGRDFLFILAHFSSIILASSYLPTEHNHRGDSGTTLQEITWD